MARPVWTGSISFGLVNVPVKLYSATSERPVRFNQLDGRNGARIRQKRVNEVTGEEVEFGDIVKGYEISKGNYVTITDEELAALGTEATHRLDLECFVDLDEIDPIYFDGAYLVAPADATKPYALLVRAMEESNRVGIARFVMRAKEHVAVLRPLDGALVMSMMVYADELAQRDQAPVLPEAQDLVAGRRLAGVALTGLQVPQPREFAQVQAVIQQRCVMCHNEQVNQKGVMLHSPALIAKHAPQINQQQANSDGEQPVRRLLHLPRGLHQAAQLSLRYRRIKSIRSIAGFFHLEEKIFFTVTAPAQQIHLGAVPPRIARNHFAAD